MLITLIDRSIKISELKKTKAIYSKGFYIFESLAAANSNYIESIEEAKQLMVYARYYLKSYLVIHDYVITKDGWQMAVRITKNSEIPEEELWRTISERVRLWLSCYVRRVNYGRKREGVLVRDSYRKYYFESLEEAIGHLDKMRKQCVKLYQKKKKYRGIKCHYQIDKNTENGSIYLCSKELVRREERVGRSSGIQLFQGLADLVVVDLVNSTKMKHILQPNHKKHPNSS